jgi:hypothetical protein
MNASRSYKGIDLMEKVIEFAKMTPNPALWKEGLLKESPPRYIRLRQINALIHAIFTQKPKTFFGKAKHLFATSRMPTVKTLLSGAFIKGRDVSAYEEFIALMKATVREKEGRLGETGEFDHKQLITVYQRLLQYKKQLMDLLLFNADEPTPSPIGLRYTVYLTNAVSDNFEGKYAMLDEALTLLLDPCKLSFSEEELQTEYNYPKEDLEEVDKNFPRTSPKR